MVFADICGVIAKFVILRVFQRNQKKANKKMETVKKKGDGRRCRLTSDALNSYGFRVLTDGVDLSLFEKNPVLLYMHRRGDVIGFVDNIERGDSEITGELVFDEASDLSVRCKKQWECGSLRMLSIGLDIAETSGDPALMVEGQTLDTVTKCRVFEVSLVDVGSNPEAIVLRRGGQVVNLCDGGDAGVVLGRDKDNNNNNNQNIEEMKLNEIANALGLPETATEDEVMLACRNSVELRNKNKDLLDELERLRSSAVAELVAQAVSDGRVSEGKKEHFVKLGKKLGVDGLKETLDAMQPRVKLADVVAHDVGGHCEWKKLSDVPSEKLRELKEQDVETYRRLYKAEYGMELKG